MRTESNNTVSSLLIETDQNICVMNALSPKLHNGETVNSPYGRPGHIAGSVNLFFMKLIDRETN